MDGWMDVHRVADFGPQVSAREGALSMIASATAPPASIHPPLVMAQSGPSPRTRGPNQGESVRGRDGHLLCNLRPSLPPRRRNITNKSRKLACGG